MSNHMKFCGCRYCRSHMGKRPVSDRLTIEVRKIRRQARQALKNGRDPDAIVSIPRTS